MKLVSPILKQIVYPCLAGTGFLRWLAGSGLAVVTYHGVLPQGYEPFDAGFDGNLVSGEMLRRQLRLLKANYSVVSPEEVLLWCQGRRELPPRAVLLTCDDGLLNNLTEMLPILQEEGLSCLFFVTGASAGTERRSLWYEELFLILHRAPAGQFAVSCPGFEMAAELAGRAQRRTVWWDWVKQLSRVDAETRRSFVCAARPQLGVENPEKPMEGNDSPRCRRFNLLTADELARLVSAGMTIGAHTMSHPILSQSPPELARAEIAESRAALESVLGKQIWALAYPFGDAASVNSDVLAMTQEAGYAAAFVNFGGGLGSQLPRYAIPRVHVTAEMRLSEFEAHVAGFHAAMQRRAGQVGWKKLAPGAG